MTLKSWQHFNDCYRIYIFLGGGTDTIADTTEGGGGGDRGGEDSGGGGVYAN